MSPSGLSARRAPRGPISRIIEPREVVDLHRLAHVEHEHVAARRPWRRLDDELRRLGDRHEVADDLGVRDGHRARRPRSAGGTADHRARAVEHIAEAHHGEDGAACRWPRAACSTISASRLLAPMMLVGRTALSVEMSTTRSTPAALGALGQRRRCRRCCCAGPRPHCARRSARACRRPRDRSSRRALRDDRLGARAPRRAPSPARRRSPGAMAPSGRIVLTRLGRSRPRSRRGRLLRYRTARGGAAPASGSGAPAPSRSSRRRPSPAWTCRAMLRAKQVDVRRHRVAAEQVVDLDRAQVADGDAPRGDVLHRRQHLHLDRLVLQGP